MYMYICVYIYLKLHLPLNSIAFDHDCQSYLDLLKNQATLNPEP